MPDMTAAYCLVSGVTKNYGVVTSQNRDPLMCKVCKTCWCRSHKPTQNSSTLASEVVEKFKRMRICVKWPKKDT